MNTRSLRSTALLTGGLCALLVLAGCGKDDAKKSSASDSPTSAATSSATATTSASASARPITGKVCDLVAPRLLKKVLSAPVEKLGYGREDLAVCGSADTVTFEFGYSIASGPTKVPDVGSKVTAVSGMGDDTRLESDEGSQTLWAERGDVVFMVRNDTVQNDSPISLDTTKRVMTQLLKRATPQAIDKTPKIETPKACPQPTADGVTKVAGTIVTARGTTDKDSVDCQYLGDGGTRLNLNVFRQADAEKDFVEYHQQDPGIEPAKVSGASQAYLTASDPTYLQLYFSTGSDTAWAVDATALDGGKDYAAGHVPGKSADVIALASSFVSATPSFK